MLRTMSHVYPLSTVNSSSRDSGQHFLQLPRILHHFSHLTKPLKKRVYFGDRSSAAASDPLPSPRIQDIRPFAFARSHGEHDSLNSLQLFFVNRKVFHITHPRQHAKDIFERPKASEHFELGKKIVKIEIGSSDFLLKKRGLLFVNCLRSSLYKAHHVAHTQNPASKPFRMERLELLNLFADSGKLDRALRYLTHGERGTAPSVTIEFGENQPRQSKRVLEVRRNADSLLPGCSVTDKKDFLWLQKAGKPF